MGCIWYVSERLREEARVLAAVVLVDVASLYYDSSSAGFSDNLKAPFERPRQQVRQIAVTEQVPIGSRGEWYDLGRVRFLPVHTWSLTELKLARRLLRLPTLASHLS